MIVTVTANPLLDLTAAGEVAVGEVRRVARFSALAGGKGLNVARVLARHGHRVMACGFAGGSSGRQVAELVAADGVEPAFTATAARTRIGFQVVGSTATTVVLEDGFPVDSGECGALLSHLRSVLSDCQLVIVSGSVPDAQARHLYRQIADLCAHHAVACWIDAYGPAMEECLGGVHPPAFAKPNREEYASLPAKRWLTCRELHVSDGPRGIRILHPDGRFHVTPPNVHEVNALGSGDCYVAALAHARLADWPLAEQCRYAAAAGAANAARADVAMITPDDIAALVEQVRVVDDP